LPAVVVCESMAAAWVMHARSAALLLVHEDLQERNGHSCNPKHKMNAQHEVREKIGGVRVSFGE
jgi:hypothetical protein